MPQRVSNFLLLCLLAIVVFDPSDSLTGLKKFAFLGLLLWWLTLRIASTGVPRLSPAAIGLFLAFGVVLPGMSMLSYYLQGGDLESYAGGLQTFVGFLSLFLLVIVSSLKVSFLEIFNEVLTAQAFATIALSAFLYLNADWVTPVTLFGYDQGFLWLNPKAYGGFEFQQIFFKTAPFMVLPVAYYSSRVFRPQIGLPLLDIALLIVCALGLFISGTRANIMFSVLIPVYFAARRMRNSTSSQKLLVGLLLVSFAAMIALNLDVIGAMFDTKEESNSVKLGYWDDYVNIFSDTWVLMFGQGIGVTQYFNSLGLDLQITEVTLLELVRNFGIIIACAYIVFWCAPIVLLRRRQRNLHWLLIGYGAYLLISVSNYFILSSTGMVLLSIVYSAALSHRVRGQRRARTRSEATPRPSFGAPVGTDP